MSNLSLRLYPYETLMKEATLPVDNTTVERAKRILKSFPNGIGLAANQIGSLERFFIMYKDCDKNNEIITFINPMLVSGENVDWKEEACLSFPGIRGIVSRFGLITVSYNDSNGENHIEEFSGLNARCIQHEIDHLNGINIIDRFPLEDREKNLKTINNLKKRK